MATNYYRKYVEEGRCARCGAYLPKGFEYKECDPCRERENILARRRRRENSKKTTEPTKKRGYTLEEVSRMAVERGISYGQMVILLEQGKV